MLVGGDSSDCRLHILQSVLGRDQHVATQSLVTWLASSTFSIKVLYLLLNKTESNW